MTRVLWQLIFATTIAGLFGAGIYSVCRDRRFESFVYMLAASLLLVLVWP